MKTIEGCVDWRTSQIVFTELCEAGTFNACIDWDHSPPRVVLETGLHPAPDCDPLYGCIDWSADPPTFKIEFDEEACCIEWGCDCTVCDGQDFLGEEATPKYIKVRFQYIDFKGWLGPNYPDVDALGIDGGWLTLIQQPDCCTWTVEFVKPLAWPGSCDEERWKVWVQLQGDQRIRVELRWYCCSTGSPCCSNNILYFEDESPDFCENPEGSFPYSNDNAFYGGQAEIDFGGTIIDNSGWEEQDALLTHTCEGVTWVDTS